MNLLTGNIKKIYFKYMVASMGSAIIMSIYSIVDTVAVGQYIGPDGTAAMAVINPIWGITVFFSMLCGIGGAVLMSNAKGAGDDKTGNNYFSVALILMLILTVILWIIFAIFAENMLRLFGADDKILPLAMEYVNWMRAFFPFFILSPFLSVFIRNDNAPNLAMAAVVAGGVFNIFGDWFFVFPMNMGMTGAALATVLGNVIQIIILGSRFFSKKTGLKFTKPYGIVRNFVNVISTGFSAGLIDLANAILVILFNAKIMAYAGGNTLAVFGVVCTCASLFQALFSGVGQAAQPIISTNFGAQKNDRIHTTLRMSMITVILTGIVFALIGFLAPTTLVKLFMNATPEVLEIAPSIIRIYFSSFLLMGINVLGTYYFQSVMQTRLSLVVSLLRGIVISGVLVNLLPMIFGGAGIWWTMPITELLITIVVIFQIKKLHIKQNLIVGEQH